MKKVILAALVILSTGVLSAFTLKNDTAVATKHDTVSDRKELSTADAKTSPKHNTTNDRKELSTAD